MTRSYEMLRPKSDMHGYQTRGEQFIIDNPTSALFIDMGLGKTITALSAIIELLNHLKIYGVLVLGPLRVIETVWTDEINEWLHVNSLKAAILRGTHQQKMSLLNQRNDIYLANYEQLPWLARAIYNLFLSYGRYPPFDMVILDELNMVKNHTAQRAEALRYLLPYIPRRVGLTGTPAPNGLQDLFGQFFALDDGKRLGTSRQAYLDEFFVRDGYRYRPRMNAKQRIYNLIEDMTLTMEAEEFLELPEIIVNDIQVTLPEEARKLYDKAESDYFIELDSGAIVDIQTAAVLATKCLQIANGHVYTDPETQAYDDIHDTKLKALDEVLGEANGSPVLVAYAFRADAQRIAARYKKKYRFINLTETKEPTEDVIAAWNNNEYDFMLGHPASMGHGLNLQKGGGYQIAMFGLNWRRDLYDQVIARLRRQGQAAKNIIVHRILATDTWDEIVRLRLEDKARTENDLKKALVEYRNRRGL